MITIGALHVFPVKSCGGIALTQSRVTPRGLQYDREWMVVTPDGRFLSQRDAPRLALVGTALRGGMLELTAPGLPPLSLPLQRSARGPLAEVTVWRDTVLATDEGDRAASWFGEHLYRDVRLVRFDDARPRPTDPLHSQGLPGTSAFADGFPVLVLAQASLDDLNARLQRPLPMDRFRPNVVLAGCAPHAEDFLSRIDGREEGDQPGVRLRLVKPCTRCVITTIDQATAVASEDTEPLRTLRTYRWNAALHGVAFGQNAIVERAGTLRVGELMVSDAAE